MGIYQPVCFLFVVSNQCFCGSEKAIQNQKRKEIKKKKNFTTRCVEK